MFNNACDTKANKNTEEPKRKSNKKQRIWCLNVTKAWQTLTQGTDLRNI